MTQQTNPTPTTQDTELDEILDRLIDNAVESRLRWKEAHKSARNENRPSRGFSRYQGELRAAHTEAKKQLHQWAERKYGEREAERYSWDSVSIGWNDKEQHERVLLLIKDGKVVQSLLTNDDAILRNYSYDKKRDRYLHNDLVRASHIELWAEQAIAQLTPTTTPNDDERED